MPLHSRNKGRNAERELEKIIESRSIEVDRNIGGRVQKYGDLRIPGVAIECRRRETVSITRWSKEHEADVPEHLIPAVAYRTSGEPWRVSIPLTDFLDLYESSKL